MVTPSKLNNKEFLHLLDLAIEAKASDLHIQYNIAPMIRVEGMLKPLAIPAYTPQKCNELIADFLGESRLKQLLKTLEEVDFSFSYEGFRLRCNVFLQRGILSATLRFLSNDVRNFDELGIPPLLKTMTEQNQGLIIVSGPTGHGKSSTLAALVNYISGSRRGHILTIEDPIEYIYENKKSIVTQREVGIDTPSFSSALRAAYREDPDVVLVGEMRDLETMEAALQIAESGHLVLTSLHTNSAAQTANRIIDVFPPHQQDQIRIMLSEVLLGIVSQRLVPRITGGRALATEVLIANPAVRSLIRDSKTHQIPNLIMTSSAEGMVSLDKSLAELVSKGEVAIQDALAWSLDPKTLRTMIY